MKNRQENSVMAFRMGFNCAQSVITSFKSITKLNDDAAIAIASGFGGGMGKMQQVCGAVTGSYMVLSMYAGLKYEDNVHRKAEAEKLVRNFTEKFIRIHGTTMCNTLMPYDLNDPEEVKKAREKALFEKVCEKCISDSVGILEEMMEMKTSTVLV